MHNKRLSKTPSSINTNSQAAEQNPKLAYRPFGSQIQKASAAPVTQSTKEDVAFAEQKMEAFGLELQAKYGKITSEGQERLTVLQAKMASFSSSQLEHARRFSHNIANIPLTRPDTPIQAKLTIGEPGDKYEQEADETARQVVQRIHQPQSEKLQRESLPDEEDELQMKPEGNIQRESLPDEEDELQMKPMVQRVSDGGMAATQDLEASINQARGGGQPLANNIREPMEQGFGADFSRVKVHTDTQSDQLNRSIQAKAFTTGQDVFFRQGAYEPGSRGGQELIAHELTHVVQQSGIIQRKVTVAQQVLDALNIWIKVKETQFYQEASLNKNEEEEAKKILEKWVSAPGKTSDITKTSEDRKYETMEDVARALIGEVKSQTKKQAQSEVAKAILENEQTKRILNKLMMRIKAAYNIPEDSKEGRYSFHYDPSLGGKLFKGLNMVLGTHKKLPLKDHVLAWNENIGIEATISLLMDIALVVRSQTYTKINEAEREIAIMSQEQEDGRKTHWNPEESAEWTKKARESGEPLSAGPSATTGQLLLMARAVGASADEMLAAATSAFAFWNQKAYRHQSGIHTMHEVISIHQFNAEVEQKYQKWVNSCAEIVEWLAGL